MTRLVAALVAVSVTLPLSAQQTPASVDEQTRQAALEANRRSLEQPHEMCTCWSPVDDVIAFQYRDESGNFDIYTIDADGTNLRRLTSAPTKEGNVTWSGDGTELVYHSGISRSQEWDIHAMNRDGSNVRVITRTPGRETHPAMSPTTDTLAYQGLIPETRNSEVYLLDQKTGSVENITRRGGFDGMPHWFADGTRLLYSRREESNELMVFDTDSGTHRRLTSTDDVDEYGHGISSDGKIVYYWARYAAGSETTRQDIFGLDIETGNVRQLTNDADVERCPTPSPDGSRLAFGVDDKDVAIMNLETNEVTLLGVPTKIRRLQD